MPHKAAGVILVSGDRLLLMRRAAGARDHVGTWSVPFGCIEGNESPEETARRELFEETGYHVDGELFHLYNDADTQSVTFIVDVEGFEPLLSDEHDEAVWTTIYDLPEPLHPGLDLLHQLRDEADTTDATDIDLNGYVTFDRVPISRVGVFDYLGAKIPGADPEKLYKVYRPADELSDPEAVASFRMIPWINNHEMLGLGATPAEHKGVHGIVGDDVYFEDGILYGNLRVFSETLVDLLDSGKTQLSLGYRSVYEPKQGTYEGQKYDYVQRTMRGNHIALVENGRMGPEIAITMDHADITINFDEVTPMKKAQLIALRAFAKAAKAKMVPVVDAIDPAIKPATDDPVIETDPDNPDGDAEAVADDITLADAKEVVEVLLPMMKEVVAMANTETPDSTVDANGVIVPPVVPASAVMDAAEKAATVATARALGDARAARKLASQLTSVIGVFDHDDMSLAQVVEYGCTKLELPTKTADALSGFLAATAKYQTAGRSVVVSSTTDAADAPKSAFSDYLNG